MDLVRLFLLTMAARRLARVVVEDRIGESLRAAAEANELTDYLANCFACTSFWTALISTLLPTHLLAALAAAQMALDIEDARERIL